MINSWAETAVKEVAAAVHIRVSPAQIGDLVTYLRLLREWNRTINLVSRKRFDRAVADRLFDALLIWREFEPWDGKSHLDIGSGSGFPAIPIHVMAPEERLKLVEPRGRRAAFLHVAATDLGFDDVEILSDRIEWRRKGLGELGKFEFVTAQAVKPIVQLAPVILENLAPDGRFVWAASGKLGRTDRERVRSSVLNTEITEVAQERPGGGMCWIGCIRRIV